MLTSLFAFNLSTMECLDGDRVCCPESSIGFCGKWLPDFGEGCLSKKESLDLDRDDKTRGSGKINNENVEYVSHSTNVLCGIK